MDSGIQWIIMVLFLALILLIILLFSKTPFLRLFTADHGWEKIGENSGILEHWTSSLTPYHIRYQQQPFHKTATLCASKPFDGLIRMNYSIQDEKSAQRCLARNEDMAGQQALEGAPDVHVIPERLFSSEQVQCASQMQRCISTDSLDSAASSIMEISRDVPTAKLTLKYDHATQMFSSQLHHLTDVYDDYGQIWLLFFLLPHPKPLWRTEIALLVQLFSSRYQSASVVAQARIRLKDLSLTNTDGAPVQLALHPNKKSSVEEIADLKLGEILFLAAFSLDRLTVIVSKIRNLSPVYKSAFIRLYVVQPMGQVTKKKTSERLLVDGAADFGESMFFTISRSRVVKSHLRLSIVCESEEARRSIGHVTLGPKSSGKELGHWQRALSGEGPPLVSWHIIRPRGSV